MKSAVTNGLHPVAHSIVTVNAGPDVDAANNDFRRIQNAIDAATAGDTIILNGTFDFTQPFAAAAWALGNDNTNGTADDYSVYVPANLNSITLTATSLGTATIQGPGDLAAVNLEGFLVFDGGKNQGWTISNLRILDFDLSIGFFNGAGGVDAFNNTVIQNNFIRVPADLNATVAPADVNQNIGIHYSFGTNQSIMNNRIDLAGNAVSAGPTLASDVGMQSNTSGGAVYDGLTISGNQIHVINAQSANPERVLGIWENGHAHLSNITVANNQFINDSPGNDPALNLQRAFRVTSHSGTATTVTYSSNLAGGANIGLEWLAGSNFTANQAVRLVTNTLTGCKTGVLVQSSGIANSDRNIITGSGSGGGIHVVIGSLTGAGAVTDGVFRTVVAGGSGDGIAIDPVGSVISISENDLSGNAGFGLRNASASSVVATRNWWGNNLAAAVAAEVSGPATFDPWLASGTDVSAAPGFQPFLFATTSGAITTFAGTPAADTGSLLAGNPVTMTMNGQTAFTALAQLLNFDIQLGMSDDVFTLGATGVPTTFDGGAGNDTLIGPNVAATWNITSAGSGSAAGIVNSFTGVETLRGGTANDAFIFGPAGSLAQALDGNLGNDTLNNSAIPASTITPTGPGTLDGTRGTATGIGVGFDNINTLVASPVDVSVSKTGPPTVNAGTAITYSIQVTNPGPGNALNVTLSDPLPAGTTFVSLTAPGGWSCTTPAPGANGTVNCSLLSMPAVLNTFTLVVNAPNVGGSVSNTATISAVNDPVPANNASTATTTVQAVANVSITKTGPATATSGTNINYTISVNNAGPQSASSVVVTDVLPANVTFQSTTPSQGSCSGTTTVTCNLGPLANGASATITLIVNNTAASGATVVNTATVTSPETDPTPANNSSTASTGITPAVADVVITKSGPATVAPGANINYTISVTNAGPQSASSVVVTDVLPANVTFQSATPSQGSCSGTTMVTCNLSTLANGASATIALAVNNAAASGATIANTATVAAAESDPSPANNRSTASTVVSAAIADVAIAKSGPATVGSGANINYTITVTNAGPQSASGVVVTDVLPANVVFQSAAPSQGSCTGTTTVTCNLGTLANGANATIQLIVSNTIASGTVANTATVTAVQTDPTPANNRLTASTSVSAAIPALSEWTLLALALALAAVALSRKM